MSFQNERHPLAQSQYLQAADCKASSISISASGRVASVVLCWKAKQQQQVSAAS